MNFSDPYVVCCQGHDGFKANMPETVGRMFLTLFCDETWTWSGLAELMKARFRDVDISEFIYLLDNSTGVRVPGNRE